MTLTRRSLLQLGLGGMLLFPLRPVAGYPSRATRFDAWRREFEAGMPSLMRAAKVPGAAMAITAPGAHHYTAAFGMADIQQGRRLTAATPMHLASVSKLATALALVQLFERKGHDLHEGLDRYLDFPVRNPRYPKQIITPHHLLTHTSSISDEGYGDLTHPGDSPQKLSDFLSGYLVEGGNTWSRDGSFLPHPPGASWSYSNVGMALAGHVVEAVSGQSFASYVQANVFTPLGIEGAHWSIAAFGRDVLATPYVVEANAFTPLPQQGYPDVPAGMLRCSVHQLATLLNAMLPGMASTRAIASDETLARMLRSQVDPAIAPYQGLGWVSEDGGARQVIGHSGSDPGASNMVALSDDRRHAVVVLMNVDGSRRSARFRDRVTHDLLGGAALLD